MSKFAYAVHNDSVQKVSCGNYNYYNKKTNSICTGKKRISCHLMHAIKIFKIGNKFINMIGLAKSKLQNKNGN